MYLLGGGNCITIASLSLSIPSLSLSHLFLMGRPPCCDKSNVKRGPWTAEEDAKILAYISSHGIGNWTLVPQKAGLNRCGKSCRLRWTNYLRPDLKHDNFTPQEEHLIVQMHKAVGSRWSLIAKQLPGRTDNDVKNYWNTKLRKKLSKMGIDPITHKPFSQILADFGNISSNSKTQSNSFRNNALFLKSDPRLFPAKIPTMAITTPPFQDDPFAFHPNFFNEIPSFCSSSSSSFQQSQTQIPSSFSSSSSSCPGLNEFQLGELLEEEQNMGCELQGIVLSSRSSSFSEQNENSFGIGDEKVRTILDKSVGEASSAAPAVDSFVETLIERDCEMQMEFPQLLGAFFDYY